MKKIQLVLFFAAIATGLAAQPANDDPCGAHVLVPALGVCQPFEDTNPGSLTSIFNATGTTVVSDYVCSGDDPVPNMRDVWFKIPLSSANTFVKAQPITGFTVSLALYFKNSGSCSSDDLSLFTLSCTNGSGPGEPDSLLIPGSLYPFYDTIYLRVFHDEGGPGSPPVNNSQFSICAYTYVPPPPPPPCTTSDDPCCAHLIVPSQAMCQPFEDNSTASVTSLLNATTTTGYGIFDYTCDGNPAPALKDVWFKIPFAPANMIIKTTPIPGFDVSFHVYYRQSGSCSSEDLLFWGLDCANQSGPGEADSVFIPYNYSSFIDTIYLRVFHHPDGTGIAPVNNSQFSICAYFPAPDCATLTHPADNAQVLDLQLGWDFAQNATEYDVYVGTTIAGASYIGTTNGTSFNNAGPDLSPGIYYWYVVPKNGAVTATGCASSARSLTILETAPNNKRCNAVVLTPTNENCNPYSDTGSPSTTSYYMSTFTQAAFGGQANCTFSSFLNADVWFKFTTPDSAFYNIKVNPVTGINTSFRVFEAPQGCNQDFIIKGCFNTGAVAVQDTGLLLIDRGKEYFIQVFSQNGSRDFNPPGNSQFSICVIKQAPVCQVPLLISPLSGAFNVDHISGQVSWNIVEGATHYDFYVGTTALNMVKVNYTSLQTELGAKVLRFANNFMLSSPFSPATQYFWKVVPRNADVVNSNCTPEIRNFTTVACPPSLSSALFGNNFRVSAQHAGELEYRVACPNCPPSWLVFEYGPNWNAGTGTTAAPGNFIVYPVQLVSRLNIPANVGIDSPHHISTYRYHIRSVGCPTGNLSLLDFDPGTPVQLTPCATSQLLIFNGKGRWNFNGQYPINSNSNPTTGKMTWFNFTPTETGVYYLQVDSVETNDPVDYLYKPDSLNRYSPTGWTGISEINAKGKYAIGHLTAGVLYHFVADRQNDSIQTLSPGGGLAKHFVMICKADVAAPLVNNTCIEANIRKPIPASSPKEEFAIDATGKLVASIKAGTDSLGLVNVSYYVNANGLRHDGNNREYLDRNYTITPSIPVSSVQQVKLFFTNEELSRLTNATINDLVATKTDQPCSTSSNVGNNGNTLIQPNDRGAYDPSSGYIKIPVSNITTFYLHTGTIPLSGGENLPLTITCPTPITVSNNEGVCGATITGIAPAVMNGTSPYVITYIITGATINTGIADASGTFFNTGINTITYYVTDNIGNTATCSFNVTVNDTEPPTITCPLSTTIGTNTGCNYVGPIGTATATDNCGVLTITNNAPSAFPLGNTNVTWTASDAAGNSVTCTQIVTVIDDDLPTITCPAAATFGTNSGCAYTGPIGTATGTDNCGAPTITSNAPAAFPLGNTTVTWRATDGAGNSVTCTQIVTVVGGQFTINCPAAATFGTNTGCTYVGSIGTATSTGSCSSTTITNNAPAAFPLGNNTITWRATDASGNSITCTQVITVIDDDPPSLSCPASVTINCQDSQSPSNTGNATATDNCGTPVISYTDVVTPGNCSGNYSITRTWNATDASNNSSVCTQVITVRDITPPTVICKNITVTLNSNGMAMITAAMINNGSSDNCGIASMTLSVSVFYCTNIGVNIVVLTVKDHCGNASTGIALVTVIGLTSSCTITAIPSNNTYTGGVPTNIYLGYGPQSVTLQANTSGGVPNSYLWTGLGLSCYTCSNPVFAPVLPGTYVFTVVITNQQGCITTCSITICVRDIRVPGTNGSKVYVCHLPPGNPGNPQTLSVSLNAVPAHIQGHAGDRLGSCLQVQCSTAPVPNYAGRGEEVASEEITGAAAISVLPNPNTGQFTVRLQNLKGSKAELSILDANGAIIEKRNVQLITNGNSVLFNLRATSAGMYYLKVVSDEGIHTEKIVIHH